MNNSFLKNISSLGTWKDFYISFMSDGHLDILQGVLKDHSVDVFTCPHYLQPIRQVCHFVYSPCTLVTKCIGEEILKTIHDDL